MTSIAKNQSVFSQGYLFLGRFSTAGANFRNLPKIFSIGNFKNNPVFKSRKVMVGLVVLILVVGGFWLYKSKSPSSIAGEATYIAEGPQVTIGKKFNIAIRDSEGTDTGSALSVNTTHLERTEKVLYQGKPLVAKSGKDFLVINLEVENSTNDRLTVRPVDFYRLIDDSGKSYAADIQTEDVKVQAQSSKKTRVIYIIGDNQKNIKLVIGEIRGENKETIEVAI